MKIHLEPELQSEKLKKPATVSVACHAALFLIVALWGLISPPPFQFGELDGDEGSAVAVNITSGVQIPVPKSAPNPVANPVEHEVPAAKDPPKPAAPEKPLEPEPEAVPVEEPRKTSPKPVPPQKTQETAPEKPDNQSPSSTGARAASPIFSSPETGAGGVGVSGRNPFGQGFAWYANDLRRKLSAEWKKTLGQASGSSSKPVVVRFSIFADGRIQGIRVVESSGNRSLDYSAHRAVQYINPFTRLPPGLGRSAITVEMTFNLE